MFRDLYNKSYNTYYILFVCVCVCVCVLAVNIIVWLQYIML